MISQLSSIFNADTWQSLVSCDVLLACGDTNRGYVYQGKQYAHLIDSLGDLFRLNGVSARTVAHRLSHYIGNKGYSEPVSMNRALFRIKLGEQLIILFKGRTAGKFWREARETQLWKNILRNCIPKVVISIQPDVGLCRAGHELGIQVFDLQHGLISDTEDNPYYFSDNLANKESIDLPHGFLCFDKSSAEVLLPMAMKKGLLVRVIGNPWFARFINPHSQDELVGLELVRCANLQRGLPIILVTLQYNLTEYARDYVKNGVMADCLEKAIHETSEQYNWILRLHPAQFKSTEAIHVQKYLKKQFGKLKNVEWETSSHAALPRLLSMANLHITHFSATTIEAAWMGLRTGLLDPHIRMGGKHADFFASERALSLAEALPLDVTAIKKFIQSSLAKGKSDMNLEQSITGLNSFIEDIKCFVNRNAGYSAGNTC